MVAALADRTGLSRAGISAIEAGRLTPSVTAALAICSAFDCTVEELFGPGVGPKSSINWCSPPATDRRRYWLGKVGDRTWAYPIEDDSPTVAWHDGVSRDSALPTRISSKAGRTLVVACCDPAAALLAAEYARQFRFRMIVLHRSSRESLALLAVGKAHVAGVHLGKSGRSSDHARVVRSIVGAGYQLVRGAQWEEGLAIAAHLKSTRIADLLQSRARWVGREAGSGARQCQDLVLGDRPSPRRMARDHRSVTDAVRCGWADVGPCVHLSSEEAGLRFLKVQDKDYDLVFSARQECDPRLVALLATLRSRRYRTRLAELPGYSTGETGELVGHN